MKVLELCLSPDLGGLELYAWRCAKGLSEAGTEAIGVLHPAGRLRGYFERDGLPWQALTTRFRSAPLAAARRLAAIIDRNAVDVVHMHWGKDLALAALAKRFSRRKPRLVYTRQMQITRPKRDIYHTFLWRQVDRVLAITEQLAGRLRTLIPAETAARVTTLYYGVDAPGSFLDSAERQAIRNELRVADDRFLVGLFGRIKASKGQHLLVDAVEQLIPKLPIEGLIVGRAMDPTYLEALKQRVAADRLPVHFVDFTDQPQRLMQACDCVVLASDEETFGLVLAEAMRAGVVVVGSDSGGVPEIIGHEQSGLLFPPGDAPGLAAQLARLAADPEFRARLAEEGRRTADHMFNQPDHLANLMKLLAGDVTR